MKRFLLALGILGSCSCASVIPTLYAQTVPYTAHAEGAPRPASENITGYMLALDGGPAVAVPLANCTAICYGGFVLQTFGAHTVVVTSQTLALSSDPTSTISSDPVSFAFTLNHAGGVTGATVKGGAHP